MVKARRVKREWSQIINETQSHWRNMTLTKEMEKYYPSILRQFDEKSNSTIQRVSIKFKSRLAREKDRSHLFKTLLKSNDSLMHLSVIPFQPDYDGDQELSLSSIVKGFPKLSQLRLYDPYEHYDVPVQLIEAVRKEEETKTGLKVLFIHDVSAADLRPLKNLKSFCNEEEKSPEEWIQVLQKASKTLKHLKLDIEPDEGSEDPQYEAQWDRRVGHLEFPQIEVLQLSNLEFDRYPSWIKIPKPFKLTLDGPDIPRGLPHSITELWIGDRSRFNTYNDWQLRLDNWDERLGVRCPLLETLRIGYRSQAFAEILLKFLIGRKDFVRRNGAIGETPMKPIKTLVVSSTFFRPQEFAKVKEMGLVEELLDLERAPKALEVRI